MYAWTSQFQLFLFDFDGLLVNTEEVHYAAYQNMLMNRGFKLQWSFAEYIKIAHYSAQGLREQIYQMFPELEKQEPDWSILYKEKTAAFLHLVATGNVQLMPGVEPLLLHLDKQGANTVVVTHSLQALVRAISDQLSPLQTIKHWITREDYSEPKPHPDSYQTAIRRFAKEDDRVVGFEDTPRGLTALLGTRATPILITELDYPEIPQFEARGVKRFRSFFDLKDLESIPVLFQ